jgi:hypothetical protein
MTLKMQFFHSPIQPNPRIVCCRIFTFGEWTSLKNEIVDFWCFSKFFQTFSLKLHKNSFN